MNCSTRTCNGTAEVREPLPLCGTCALLVMASYAAANLGSGTEVRKVPEVRQNDAQQEIRTIYRILDEEGWNSVNLDRAARVLGRPQRTAARRLADARRQYAAELARRARRQPKDI